MWPDLPEQLESEHFLVRFRDRHPRVGAGSGAGGARDRTVVWYCLDALERTYTYLTGPLFQRDPPQVGPEGKTIVRVCDLLDFPLPLQLSDPFTTSEMTKEGVEVPWIALPCRSPLPTLEGERRFVAAAAVHETVHAFNCRHRSLWEPASAPWEWFDEGMAHFGEMLVLPGNQDGLRFLHDWVDRPESSLDVRAARAQTGMFLRYLVNVMGPAFTTRLWTQSPPTETALDALVRLFGEEDRVFSSADPGNADFFGAGYCVDAYFLFDPASQLFAPEVFDRFGQRAITHSFALAPGRVGKTQDDLDHLACRYYRFYLEGNATRLAVRLQPPSSQAPLKGVLAVVTRDGRRGASLVLRRDQAGGALAGELTGLDPNRLDHLVLVVANCGLRADTGHRNRPHDDDQQYVVVAEAR